MYLRYTIKPRSPFFKRKAPDSRQLRWDHCEEAGQGRRAQPTGRQGGRTWGSPRKRVKHDTTSPRQRGRLSPGTSTQYRGCRSDLQQPSLTAKGAGSPDRGPPLGLGPPPPAGWPGRGGAGRAQRAAALARRPAQEETQDRLQNVLGYAV